MCIYLFLSVCLSLSHSVSAGLKQASVREFSVSPEGDSLLLSGNDGYLHVLKLKVCAASHGSTS